MSRKLQDQVILTKSVPLFIDESLWNIFCRIVTRLIEKLGTRYEQSHNPTKPAVSSKTLQLPMASSTIQCGLDPHSAMTPTLGSSIVEESRNGYILSKSPSSTKIDQLLGSFLTPKSMCERTNTTYACGHTIPTTTARCANAPPGGGLCPAATFPNQTSDEKCYSCSK